MLRALCLSFFLVELFLCGSAFAESLEIKNFDKLAEQMGFIKNYSDYEANKKATVRVAILDNSFESYEEELGKTLPEQTQLHLPPIIPEDEEKAQFSKHGLFMAELLVKFMTNNNQMMDLEPELHLFPYASKYSNFKWAVEEAIRLDVDVILYSTVWDYGGNHDGKGILNAVVNQALDAGIIWVNAAGNLAQSTFNSAIEADAEGWVKLPGPNNTVSVRCEPVADKKECPLRLTLSWNDFHDDISKGTDKDLDLILSDDALNIFENNKGALVQKSNPQEGEEGVSKYPREIIDVSLKKGLYLIRVKKMSDNFDEDDRLRLVGDGDGISFDQKDREENLLNPADNARVLTVGASESNKSSVSKKLQKPNIYAPSSINLSETENFLGSSNSAAIVAAGVALSKMVNPDLTRDDFLQTQQTPPVLGKGLTLKMLGFGPTGEGNCFEPVSYSNIIGYVQDVLDQGGVLVQTTVGVRIMVPFDPIQLAKRQIRGRVRSDDMIMITPVGYVLRPRSELHALPPLTVPPHIGEVVQIPKGTSICGQSSSKEGEAKIFRLPAL